MFNFYGCDDKEVFTSKQHDKINVFILGLNSTDQWEPRISKLRTIGTTVKQLAE